MSFTTTGVIVGLLLAIAAILGGFNGFLLALVFGVLGWVIAAQIDGRLDIGAFLGGRRRG